MSWLSMSHLTWLNHLDILSFTQGKPALVKHTVLEDSAGFKVLRTIHACNWSSPFSIKQTKQTNKKQHPLIQICIAFALVTISAGTVNTSKSLTYIHCRNSVQTYWKSMRYPGSSVINNPSLMISSLRKAESFLHCLFERQKWFPISLGQFSVVQTELKWSYNETGDVCWLTWRDPLYG